MKDHHPWCNYFMRPVEGCEMCAGLWERYPFEPGENLMAKYFPQNIADNPNRHSGSEQPKTVSWVCAECGYSMEIEDEPNEFACPGCGEWEEITP